VAEHVRTGISYQIRALRAQRGWSQKKLAEEIGKPQSVVSRLEDPDYGKLSVQTLLEVASAFDVALLIQYVNFPEFLKRTRDVSQEALRADSFDANQFHITATNVATMSHKIKSNVAMVVVGRYATPSQFMIIPPQRLPINASATVH
jgi:transcriptional regulator with XRE-family HTH domain